MSGGDDAALDACMVIVAELRAAALDPSSDLAMAERYALAGLAAAVEAEAARRAGIDLAPSPATAETSAVLVAMGEARDGG